MFPVTISVTINANILSGTYKMITVCPICTIARNAFNYRAYAADAHSTLICNRILTGPLLFLALDLALMCTIDLM